MKRKRAFFADDGGFSTVGMALALLISLSLILTSAQVYRMRSTAAGVQNVADACALAAQNQVASFYVVAQVCDSVVLSLSLVGVVTLGVGVVTACVPATQGVSVKFIEVGKTVLDARTKFARAAAKGLARLQGLLPVFAALDAAAVARSNSQGSASYWGTAILAPFTGEDIDIPEVDDKELLEEVEEEHGTIASAADAAEDAAEAADVHKQLAFLADCGDAPGYCMYERAASLAGLSGASNPLYHSVDAWSFGVALERARAYYQRRSYIEAPASDDVGEQARSAIRRHFYQFASEKLAEGYVYDTEDSFSAYFPLLPRNTDQMRSTSLYTDYVYPVSEDEEGFQVMHAWGGCPGMIGEFAGYGSVSYLEEYGLDICAYCEFSATSVGKVASASTSISNGFEYHYQVVAQEAELYAKEREKLARLEEKVKSPVERLLDMLKDALSSAADCRIEVYPPGRFGAIAVVVDTADSAGRVLVGSGIVAAPPALGTRMAVSAATLANDDSSEVDTVVSSLLDGLASAGLDASLPSAVLGLWSDLLVAYARGTRSLVDGVSHLLDSLPLVGAAGLGTWAAQRLQTAIDDAGLTPTDLVSRKPVVVNTYHVAAQDSSSFSKGLLSAKQAVAGAYGGIAADPLSAVVGIAGGKLLSAYDDWDASFVIARIELLGPDGPSIPVEIALPSAVKNAGADTIQSALDAILGFTSQGVEVRRWE